MTVPFMRSYSLLCIKTCHHREAHAMGGMAAQIPVKNDPQANEEAFPRFARISNVKPRMDMMVRGWPTRKWST